jgi:LacI family transcriptional regulator
MLGVEHAAIQQGFHVLLKPVDPGDTGGYARLITENHVDGILLSGPRQDDAALMNLHRQHVPILLMGQLPGTDIPFVDIDATAGAQLAVDHLIERGHRRIGIITNAPLDYISAQQRCDGYLQALRKANLTIDQTLIKEGNYTPASGFEAMQALLQLTPRLTAVFVASDVVAMGAMLAIKEAGLGIPKDIAMTGFDDIPLAEFYDPPLTTIRLPAFDLGRAGGERLIRLIHGDKLDRQDVLLESKLIARKSSFENLLPN